MDTTMLKEQSYHSMYFTNSPLFGLYQPSTVSKLPLSEYLLWATTSLKQLKWAIPQGGCLIEVPLYWDRQAWANCVGPHQMPQNAESDQSTLFATHPAIFKNKVSQYIG